MILGLDRPNKIFQYSFFSPIKKKEIATKPEFSQATCSELQT